VAPRPMPRTQARRAEPAGEVSGWF
jgi:hypothetical protein